MRERRHPMFTLCLCLAFVLLATVAARAEARVSPRIEICFALDTTGSMANLIDGARKKMWAIANEVVRLEPQPDVSFCLMAFRDRGDEYVTQLTDLSRDMDHIYQRLSALVAAGGGDEPEAVNQALFETITLASWSGDDDTIRVIYLVGDAPPHNDYDDEPTQAEILAIARRRGIVVSAILCGNSQTALAAWRRISADGDGRMARVARDGNVRVRPTPLDQDLVALQGKLAATVLPWGDDTRRAAIEETHARFDAAAGHVVADRLSYVSRVGRLVEGEGDLIADLAAGRVSLDTLDESLLPSSLRDLHPDARRARLEELRRDRQEYLTVIAGLVAERAVILAEDPRRSDAFDTAVIEQIKELAAARGYRLD